MMNPNVQQGNGLILYFKTDQYLDIHEKAKKMGVKIVEELHLNNNSLKMEFSIRDLDGYFISITENHNYEG